MKGLDLAVLLDWRCIAKVYLKFHQADLPKGCLEFVFGFGSP
jgi:hypothetical protein